MKQLQTRNIKGINPGLLVPLNCWCSGNKDNLKVTSQINRMFFKVDKNILLKYLSLGIKPSVVKGYPKSKKLDTKRYDLVCSLLVKLYRFTDTNLESMKSLIKIKMNDFNYLEELSVNLGLENKERKILGLKNNKVVKMKVPKSRGLLDY